MHTGGGPATTTSTTSTKDFTKVGFTPRRHELNGEQPAEPDAAQQDDRRELHDPDRRPRTSSAARSPAARAPAAPANNNKWQDGDEYSVEGNALAWLGYILDNLDKLVDQVDQIDPGLTDKEIPLVGISTKELVGKIQSIKQTTDELRGSPLAQIDCTQQRGRDERRPAFDLEPLVRRTRSIYCRAVTTVEPRRGHVDREGASASTGPDRRRNASLARRPAANDPRHGRPDRRPRASRSRSATTTAPTPLIAIERVAHQGRVHGRGRRPQRRVPDGRRRRARCRSSRS